MIRALLHGRNVSLARRYSSTPSLLKIKAITVPPLGENNTEGSIARWEKDVGEIIHINDVVVTIECDKVTIDVKSAYGGMMIERYAGETETVNNSTFKVISN